MLEVVFSCLTGNTALEAPFYYFIFDTLQNYYYLVVK